jgi:ABC-type lipoprotein export system ATPase subunit
MPPLLSLDCVSKSYWRGLHELQVLTDVSLDVHAGELIAVWGQHRSGKTTLLKIAAGLAVPTAGTVRLEQRDLADLSRGELARMLRSRIAWAKASGPDSRELRVIDYVALPLLREHGRREAHRRAALALAHVGVPECAAESWCNLADSERALVAIAHAVVRAPKLLLVDEQTARLDEIERERIMTLLRSTAEACAIGVLVTVPDMAEMTHAHRFMSLSGGRLLSPAERPQQAAAVLDFPSRTSSGGSGAFG